MTPFHVVIDNVSRRGFLKGVLATGGLVIAAEFVPARAEHAVSASATAAILAARRACRRPRRRSCEEIGYMSGLLG